MLSWSHEEKVEAKVGLVGHSVLLELGPRDTIHLQLMSEVSRHGSNPNPGS